jgi:hypothetical protein
LMDNWIDKAATHRVLEGVRQYGVIDLSKDHRCFNREATEELLDSMNYLQWAFGRNQVALEDHRWMTNSIRTVIENLVKCCPKTNQVQCSLTIEY